MPTRAIDTPVQRARVAFFLWLSVRFAHVYQAVLPEGGDNLPFERLGFLSVHLAGQKRRLLTNQVEGITLIDCILKVP